MYSRWFQIAVVTLWLATMSWLVTTKVLPAILIGEPPSHRTIVEAQRGQPPVAWDMFWNDRPMGWAVNTSTELPHDLTELRSRVHFDDIPLNSIPGLGTLLGSARDRRVKLPMDVFSLLVFDPLGRLSRFESSVRFDPDVDAIKVRGVVDAGQLSLTIRSGDFTYDRQLAISPKSMLGDGLSPQTRLPGLRDGQAWTVELYSPFHSPDRPLEVLKVQVEGSEPMVWDGETVNAWLVVYRTDPGSGGRNAGAVRGKLWVRRDGLVLQQQVMAALFNSTLTFTRLPDNQAVALAERVAGEKTDRNNHD